MEENAAVLETPEVIKHTDTEWYRDRNGILPETYQGQ